MAQDAAVGTGLACAARRAAQCATTLTAQLTTAHADLFPKMTAGTVRCERASVKTADPNRYDTPVGYKREPINHVVHEKQKLLNRVRRIRGQVDAVERAIDGDQSCAAVMNRLTACRGAINGLLAEVVEDHVREHLMGTGTRSRGTAQAADELIDIVHAYFK